MSYVSTQYKAPLKSLPAQPQKLSPLDAFNYHSKDTNWDAVKQSLNQNNWEAIMNNKEATEILDILYEKVLDSTKDNLSLRQHNKNKLTKNQRSHKNLTRKRRRINKQYQKATSTGKKAKLYTELINIEIKF